MQHIHAREWLRQGRRVEVQCNHQCNVLLMDDANYSRYRRGQSFRHYGGFFEHLPAIIGVPATNHWNTVIDLAGDQAKIRYAINYLG